METISILGELVDNRNANFLKMKNRRHNNHRSNNRKRQQNQNHTPKISKFNYGLVPAEVWTKIFSYCDHITLDSLKMTCLAFYNIIDSNANLERIANSGNAGAKNFANMPSEIILSVFKHLNKTDLANCARVCHRFRDLTTADCLWISEAKQSLATNNSHAEMKNRSVQPWLSAQDRVRISHNWVRLINFWELLCGLYLNNIYGNTVS